MKILVFGSTGGTGKQIIMQALAAGHEVSAYARDPAKLSLAHMNLELIKGDAQDHRRVDEAVQGKEVIISALGVKPGQRPILSDAMANIIAAMRKHGVKRLIVESAYGVGDSNRGLYATVLNALIPSLIKDKEHMETMIKASNLSYLIVRPTILTDGKLTSRYRAGDIKVSFLPMISRADVAEYMVKNIETDHVGIETLTG